MMFEPWQLALAVVAAVFAVAAGAWSVAWSVRGAWDSATAAHKRLDRLEQKLTDEFHALRVDLREAIDTAWRNCPLAMGGKHERK